MCVVCLSSAAIRSIIRKGKTERRDDEDEMCASDHEVEWRSEKKGRRERERADRHGDEVESSDNDDEAESDGDYIEGEVGGGAACDGGR